MPFFWRRKPKRPTSTIFIPLLKLFKSTHRSKSSEKANSSTKKIPLDSGSPIFLSGPKSKYGLGISFHFIIMPKKQKLDTKLIWHFARQEMRNALRLDGVVEAEAEMYAHRLIDPLALPSEITVEYPEEDIHVLENFQRLVTYQLIQGQHYTGSRQSLIRIYSEIADTIISLLENRQPQSMEAAEIFQDVAFRNVEAIIRQEDIEKHTILDILGKLKDNAQFFELFTEDKYVDRIKPQNVNFIQPLYL